MFNRKGRLARPIMCLRSSTSATMMVGVAFLLAACGPTSDDKQENSRAFSLVNEEVYDAPIKTQVAQYVLATSAPTSDDLKAEVLRRYELAKARGGFQYHSHPTNIYIYIYGNEKNARGDQSLWIAMLAWGPLDKGEPKAIVNGDRLAALSEKPEDRFGLSEADRKRLFIEAGAAEDRAMSDADRRVPASDIKRNSELMNKLTTQYKGKLLKDFGVTSDQLRAIEIEGVKKGWPMH